MTSRGSAAGAVALAALIVACGGAKGTDAPGVTNSSGGSGNASGGNSTASDDDDATGGTPGLRDGGGAAVGNDGSGATGAVDGGTAPISESDVEALRTAECSDWNATSTALPASLMLVVDDSLSMDQSPTGGGGVGRPGGGGRSKWDITVEALTNALNALPPETQVGLLLYPNQTPNTSTTPQDASACVNVGALVPPAALGDVGQGHRQALIDALGGADLQDGVGTPTHDALAVGYDAFYSSGLTEDGFVVLITDGQPNIMRGCVANGNGVAGLTDVDPQPIIDETALAFSQGILTFFIGSPGSEQGREWLSRAAQAGGTAYAGCSDTGPDYCHFDMTTQPDFSAALNEALAQIAGSVISCSYPIPPAPDGSTIDPNKVNMVYTTDAGSVLILRNDQPDCDVGWQYTADGTEINLCSETCAAASEEKSAKVELFFGCETKIK
jgi:hypothetical protein